MAALAEAMLGGKKYLSVTFCVYFGWRDDIMGGGVGLTAYYNESLGGDRSQTHHQ